MRSTLSSIECNCRGSTAIEYGLIAALVAVAAIGAFQSLAAANVRNWDGAVSKVQEVIK